MFQWIGPLWTRNPASSSNTLDNSQRCAALLNVTCQSAGWWEMSMGEERSFIPGWRLESLQNHFSPPLEALLCSFLNITSPKGYLGHPRGQRVFLNSQVYHETKRHARASDNSNILLHESLPGLHDTVSKELEYWSWRPKLSGREIM